MHIADRFRGARILDSRFLYGALIGMLIFGLIMLSSSSAVYAQEHFGDSFFFVKRQVLFGLIPGIVLFAIAQKLPTSFFERYAGVWYALLVFVLCLVLVPGVGHEYGTFARSWISVGPMRFQPAEVGKILYIIFLAAYLHKKGKKILSMEEGFIPTLVVAGFPCILLVLQPDVGTAMIYGGILLSMLFVSEARFSHLALLFCAGIVISAILISASPYRAARFNTFLHPELDPLGNGYHVNQALLAVGSGGFFGLGLGHSRQKFAYLPEVQADSIFAILAEELGFFISTGFLVFFCFWCVRLFGFGLASGSTFAAFVCVGVASWWFLQMVVNVGAMIGVLPLTGVPLPFVSHGGSALMAQLAGAGIVSRLVRV